MTPAAHAAEGPGETTEIDEGKGTGLATQWFALLFAPAVFFAHLQIGYMLVPWSCNRHDALPVHLAGATSVVLGGVGTWVAWRLWSALHREAPGTGGGAPPRARFLALSGFVVSAMMTFVLIAQWAAAFFLTPCQ
jgi:hypothetical protein